MYMCVIFGENLLADLSKMFALNLTEYHFY